MRPVLEEVHLDGDVVVDAGLIEGEAVLNGNDAVIGGGEEEYGWCVSGDVEIA